MLEKLKNKLHTQIPLTEFMQINPEKIQENKLITTAPLKQNINDKQTAFAGSLSSLVTVSAWSVCYLIVNQKLNFQNPMIAVIKSDTSYKAAVTEDLYCETSIPNDEEISILNEKLKTKKSASLRIKSKIIQNNKVCVSFEGIYVIKV